MVANKRKMSSATMSNSVGHDMPPKPLKLSAGEALFFRVGTYMAIKFSLL